ALGRAGDVLQANGLAALQYTDLGGPPWTNAYSHTETDAFTNQDNYEERCYATDSNGNYDPKASSNAKPGDSFAHFYSHSFTTPETDHYAECFQSQCQFYFGITASHAVTQVHIQQTADTVTGDQAVAFGLAGPYATASKDGGDLNIVAPGFFFASNQQTAFFGGAELSANFGRAPGPITFKPPPFNTGSQPTTTGTTGTGTTTT